jgi:DNA-binding MarR family transcriptional regulator
MSDETHDTRAADFIAAITQIRRRLRSLAAFGDLSWTEATVVAHLANNGPQTTADLARAQVMKPQSMGAIVASLDDRGLIERAPHPSDGRQILVALSPKGLALRHDISQAKETWLQSALARLEPQERALLFDAVPVMLRLAGF